MCTLSLWNSDRPVAGTTGVHGEVGRWGPPIHRLDDKGMQQRSAV